MKGKNAVIAILLAVIFAQLVVLGSGDSVFRVMADVGHMLSFRF